MYRLVSLRTRAEDYGFALAFKFSDPNREPIGFELSFQKGMDLSEVAIHFEMVVRMLQKKHAVDKAELQPKPKNICKHCGWNGSDELLVRVGSSRPFGPITHCCPRCKTTIEPGGER